ncbi:DUF6174 domain-containing protein [Flavobacteriaceae bacterium]|nr:DUF6174 domain-containing protein [Flavobacteriaceae bacterium]MDA8704235.1 DUF6174 domain-containing protein [Flavobacteriaceae bacterium]MDC0928715.1 DUF6174 domain-containing protein [Flavobacteriaceae bacterium]MDC0984685.1 DUF6174 domain-containing protein [Flavobacteriaceae bacterium]|tara:strand:- start:216 stop:644 length:429 start_codon:yes stop_codon:yes gene_type:complete
MTTRFSFVLFILFLFNSCSKQELFSGRELWKSLNISNYTMIQQISCFCFPEEFVLPKTIVVENGIIKTINGFSPDQTIGFESFYTINEIFQFIDSKLDKEPEFYDIEYNKEYGFPNYIWFDMSKMIADEEIGYYITEFKISE